MCFINKCEKRADSSLKWGSERIRSKKTTFPLWNTVWIVECWSAMIHSDWNLYLPLFSIWRIKDDDSFYGNSMELPSLTNNQTILISSMYFDIEPDFLRNFASIWYCSTFIGLQLVSLMVTMVYTWDKYTISMGFKWNYANVKAFYYGYFRFFILFSRPSRK